MIGYFFVENLLLLQYLLKVIYYKHLKNGTFYTFERLFKKNVTDDEEKGGESIVLLSLK